MLPNHAPLVIAEQFGTLASLYPGRIDLGLGRAPGVGPAHRPRAPAEPARRRALSRGRGGADATTSGRRGPGHGVRAVPGEGLEVPIWILGSSLFGAQLAAELGLPFAFASHFAPAALDQALAHLPRAVPAVGAARPAVRDAGRQRLRGRDGRGGTAAVHLAAAGVREPAARAAGPAAAAGRALSPSG